MSLREQIAKYIEVRPVVVEDEPDAHMVWINVGPQHFILCSAWETREEAEWVKRMLAGALENMAKETTQTLINSICNPLPCDGCDAGKVGFRDCPHQGEDEPTCIDLDVWEAQEWMRNEILERLK